MTQLQRRTSGTDKPTCFMAGPLVKKREMLALLAKMQLRGEIGTAWTEGEPIRDGQFVVHYERLTDPRSKVPWYVAGFVSFFGGVIALGALIYHSRFVLLWGALIALALVGIIAYALSRGAGSAHQCGRPSC